MLYAYEPDRIPMKASPPVVIGVDVGQKVDPTAIAVAEAFEQDVANYWPIYAFQIRHLERLPLNTNYPAVADRVLDVVWNIQKRPVEPLHHPPKLQIVVDATGVGAPVVDILRQRLAGSSVSLIEATFTHGDQLTKGRKPRTISVGKAYLVSRLQALFQTDRVKLPKGHPEAPAMMQELLNYEIKIDENANDKYGAFKTGTHDDLVTALGLAVLADPARLARARSY